MTIGSRIKNKRIEMNLSVDDLASKIGKNRATIYRYENGDIENLPVSVIKPLAKALCTTPEYLMGQAKTDSLDDISKKIQSLSPKQQTTVIQIFNQILDCF